MSMFQVSGVVLHLFDAPGRVDKTSGEVDADKSKVQIMGEIPQRNGQVKYDIITLTCHSPEDFAGLKGKRISVPLGMFAPSAGNIVYFIPEGCRPSFNGPRGDLDPEM